MQVSENKVVIPTQLRTRRRRKRNPPESRRDPSRKARRTKSRRTRLLMTMSQSQSQRPARARRSERREVMRKAHQRLQSVSRRSKKRRKRRRRKTKKKQNEPRRTSTLPSRTRSPTWALLILGWYSVVTQTVNMCVRPKSGCQKYKLSSTYI